MLGRRVIGDVEVSVVVGDLTQERVDAIVNAANAHLKHGGGVAGAIVRRGGGVIQEESDRFVAEHGPLSPGQVAVTTAGALPARAVIHTVGPRWGEGDEENKLRRAIRAVLEEAERRGFLTLAIPAVSTGIYGYPVEGGTRVIVDEVCRFLSEKKRSFQEIRLVDISEDTAEKFFEALVAWEGGTS